MSPSPDTTPAGAGTIAATTRLGAVRLAVADLGRQVDFYTRVIGLTELGREDDVVRLGADPGQPIVELEYAPGANPRQPGASGLFHLAVLVPTRRHLAEAVVRVQNQGWGFTGASDHLVSEAVYLDDPEGNGIEIYRDRPRSEWTRTAGQIDMATLPMDGRGVLATLADAPAPDWMPSGTTLGHAHLMVDDLVAARRFWADTVGFEVATDSYPGALFVAAGGYHHHIGLNTWQSRRPSDPGALGLRFVEVLVPDREELERVAARVAATQDNSGIDQQGRLRVVDPAGNRALVRTPTG